MAEVIKNIKTFDSNSTTFTTYPVGADAENVALSDTTQTALSEAGIEATDVDSAIAALMDNDDIIVLHFSSSTDDDGNTVWSCDEYETNQELYYASYNKKAPVIASLRGSSSIAETIYLGILIGYNMAYFVSLNELGQRERYATITQTASDLDSEGNIVYSYSRSDDTEKDSTYCDISVMVWAPILYSNIGGVVFHSIKMRNTVTDLTTGTDSNGNTIITMSPSGLLFGDDVNANRIATDMIYYGNDNIYSNSTITLNNTTLTGLSDPVNDTDAVPKSYVDDNNEIMILTFRDTESTTLSTGDTVERYISPKYSWDEVYNALVNDNKIVIVRINSLFYYPVQVTNVGYILFTRIAGQQNGYLYNNMEDITGDKSSYYNVSETLVFCSGSFVGVDHEIAYLTQTRSPSFDYVDSAISAAIGDAIGGAY